LESETDECEKVGVGGGKRSVRERKVRQISERER
jgi:hypothetical protein